MNIRRNRLWNTHLPRYTLASSMLVLAAGPALAQDTAALSEVVVTGYRGSLAKALDDKREHNVAIDSIYAEDISKFPDLNLADSLQRLPGVSIARDAGEGRQITVRGLGPQFTRVRINGIEALSTAGGTDSAGGTNRSRSFDFNVFASELFNNISVRKTSAAEVEEGSLGATVDLRAARPFDFDDTTIVVSGQLGTNDLSDESDPRGSALFSTRSENGRFGALLSLAYSERSLLEEGASTVRWQTGNFQALGANYAASGSTATLPQLNAAFKPRIPRYDKYVHDQERSGVTGSLQFQPSDSTIFSLDGLYSELKAERTEIFLESPVFSTSGASGLGDVEVQAAEINATNSLVFGVFDDVDIRSEARLDELSTEFTQLTFDLDHRFNDRWSLHGLAGIAESVHENPVQTTLLFDRLNVDGYVYDFRANSRLPLITYGNAPVEDPTAWTLTQIRLRPQKADNDLTTVLADLRFAPSENVRVSGGLQWKEYEFATTELRRSNGTTANIEGTIPAAAAATPIADYSELVSLSGGLDIPAGSTTTWLIPDLATAAGLFDLYDTSVFPMGIQPALGNNNSIKEEDTGVYLQVDFRAGILRGNVGVRYVETEQTASGYTFTSGSPLQTTVTRDYDNTLPALNLAVDVTDSLVLRMGAARVMTRPGLGNLTPGATVSVSGSNRTVTSGNPDLDVFEADAHDIGLEWYFAPESLLAVSLFYKDVKTFVQTIRQSEPFTGNSLGLPDSVAIAACGAAYPLTCNPSMDWQFSIPANTSGGPLKGFEVSYQQPLTFLPSPFDGFGLILNYTDVSSEIKYFLTPPLLTPGAPPPVTVIEDLTGLSGSAYNATVYYEKFGFGARVSVAYRDEYLTTVPGRNGNDIEGTAETLTVDFSASYSPNDKLTFTLEGINLTDEFSDQWVDDTGDRLSVYHHTGRQYFLGARYKF